MSVVGSEFFSTLCDIGLNHIPRLVGIVLEFFQRPVNYFFDLFRLSNYVATDNSFLSFLASLWDGVVGFSKELTTSFLSMFGFDLSLPIWQFMLTNIGLILGASIVLRLLDVLT